MKKLTLVVARSEISDVLQVLAGLGCIEFYEPDALAAVGAGTGSGSGGGAEARSGSGSADPQMLDPEIWDPEIWDVAEPIKYDIGFLGANIEELPLLETPHTCILTGWIPARSAPELEYQMNRFTAAWDIGDLSPDEAVLAPVKLFCPVLFGKMRLAGHKRFDPLVKKSGGE